MNRRSLIIASAATLAAATPLYAQSRGPSPGPSDQPSEAEMTHMNDTKRAGSASLPTGRIGVQKANHAMVKQFAQFEVSEQETIAEIIKSMQGANVTMGQGAATNAEVSMQLDAKGKEMVDKLQKAKAGVEFDREFLKGQKEGHQELLKIQEAYIKAGKLREEVNVAKLARGQIKEHLALIDTITSELRKS